MEEKIFWDDILHNFMAVANIAVPFRRDYSSIAQ